jgi:hypothetical protein
MPNVGAIREDDYASALRRYEASKGFHVGICACVI